MSESTHSIGIIGCGRWGKNLIRVFDELAEVVICCHSGDAGNRQWMRDNYPSVTLTTSFDRFLERSFDAAIVATPIGTHYSLTRQLLKQDIPTFVEKPLTTDPDSATELAELAMDREVILFVGYIFVHHPVFRYLQSIHTDSPFEYVQLDWHKRSASDVDIIANLGSHDIALLYQLFGSLPESLKSTGTVRAFGARNSVAIQATFQNANCQIRLDRLDNQKRKTGTFVTTAGDVYLWEEQELYLATESSQNFETVFTNEKEPLKVEANRFLDCVEANRTPVTNGQFGSTVTELFDGL